MKRMFFFLASVFIFSQLQGQLQDYFKKPLYKEEGHSMEGIDFIYMINLDERPEKFARCSAQLGPYGIYPYRFSAFNGWKELSLEMINEIGVKFVPGMEGGFWATTYPMDGDFSYHHELIENYGTTYFCHCTARGTIGIVMSHLSVLQDAYDSGYETIWVMEDDIQVVRDPNVLSALVKKLDKRVGKRNWDILFTDQDIRGSDGKYVPCAGYAKRPNYVPKHPEQYLKNRKIGAHFRSIGARFGAHSMIIRRSGMKKILDFMKTYNVFLPYDMEFYLPEKIKLYTVLEDVVTNQIGGPSDNGEENYLH